MSKEKVVKAPVHTPAVPAISLTLPLGDATALSQGSVWTEMNVVSELEALLAKGVEQVNATGKQVHLILTINNS